ncbi:MAG: HAMP domain-containing histidine kinase, partial [Oscillospiraceae bacterium]|nr:HAMP domain-containing histidine kinase [Oscillospiraceae bacterium]
HELKTPLTVIMTGAEMLKDSDLGPEIREKCVNNILETSHRMRSLTEEMLTLAQAENVREEMLGQRCSLSDIAEDAVLSYEPMFYEKGLELREEIAQDIATKGNETQLRQLVDILLDNARKYSLPGTTVLSLKKRGSRHCEISVSNPAEPMSKEDLEQIFERFYRVDRARTSGGSYGLGLSIARGIVRRHRGTIKAEQDDGVITFYIRLPMMV